MFDLFAHELLYRTTVSFLASIGFAFIFRVAGTFDVSAPSIALLWLYFSQNHLSQYSATVTIICVALCIWWIIFRRVATSVILSLACSVAIMLVIQALTTMIYGDGLIAYDSIPRIFPRDMGHEAVWACCLALITVAARFVWKTRLVTRCYRSVMENSDLARSYGVEVNVIKSSAYAVGVGCIYLSAVLWQSETQLKSSNSESLLLFGIAIGSWGRQIGFVRMLLLALVLSAISAWLAYQIGPVSSGISYLICAIAVIVVIHDKRTADA